MANIFTLENIEDFSEKINIDDLYEKKRQHDLNKLALFNKILNRVHVKIKTTSRQKVDSHFCWYVVPEMIIGVPKYDQGACIAYIIDKLKQNGFNVRYIHPNTLFISWFHWVPAYVRSELKKKTGVVVDEYGKVIDESNGEESNNMVTYEPKDPNEAMLTARLNQDQTNPKGKPKREYASTKTYKPSGNLVYNDDLLNRIEDKFN